MKELLFFILFVLLIIALVIALICSAVNNISALCTRTKEARKRKKEQAKFQKLQAEKQAEIAELAKQTVCEFMYGTSMAYYFAKSMITAIHVFADTQNQVLRPNGYPFSCAKNLQLLLSAVHPNSRFPSKGYPLYLEKCDYDERTKLFKAWFAPYNNTINGFVVQKVNEKTVSLLHGRFGALCLPIPDRRKLHKGDKVKVMQSSKSTDSGYLVNYYII